MRHLYKIPFALILGIFLLFSFSPNVYAASDTASIDVKKEVFKVLSEFTSRYYGAAYRTNDNSDFSDLLVYSNETAFEIENLRFIQEVQKSLKHEFSEVRAKMVSYRVFKMDGNKVYVVYKARIEATPSNIPKDSPGNRVNKTELYIGAVLKKTNGEYKITKLTIQKDGDDGPPTLKSLQSEEKRTTKEIVAAVDEWIEQLKKNSK